MTAGRPGWMLNSAAISSPAESHLLSWGPYQRAPRRVVVRGNAHTGITRDPQVYTASVRDLLGGRGRVMRLQTWASATCASVLVVLLVAACGGGGGGLVTTTGTVSGLVTNLDSHRPVVGATVSRSFRYPYTTTQSDGRYTFANGTSPQQTLVASGSRLQSAQRTVSVPPQGTATLNFGLTKFADPAIIGPSSY